MTVDECKNQLSYLAELRVKVQNKYLHPFRMRHVTETDKISREEASQFLADSNKLHLRMMVAPIVRRLVNECGNKRNQVLVQCKAYYESSETCWDIRNRFYDG